MATTLDCMEIPELHAKYLRFGGAKESRESEELRAAWNYALAREFAIAMEAPMDPAFIGDNAMLEKAYVRPHEKHMLDGEGAESQVVGRKDSDSLDDFEARAFKRHSLMEKNVQDDLTLIRARAEEVAVAVMERIRRRGRGDPETRFR